MLFLLLCSLDDEMTSLIEKIYKENKSKFYSIAYSYLKSEARANDAVSESLVKIIKNISKISALPRPQMDAFCVTIVKNTSLDIIRKDKKVVLTDDFSFIQDETHDKFYNGDFEILHKVISTLSADEKRFITLRYYEGLGLKEIAMLLHITEETAKKRHQRLISKLRTFMLMEDGIDE